MKLVDILARELKGWPDGVCVMKQTQIYGIDSGGNNCAWTSTGDINAYPEEVTRAQWQAAVDALKAESAPAWVGIGLPPVGAVCEYLEDGNGDWEKVEIVAIDKRLDYKFAVFHGDKGYSGDRRIELFRPIRTPEQIVADRRLQDIADALTATSKSVDPWNVDINCSSAIRATVEAMIDAGYRKFEIVDN